MATNQDNAVKKQNKIKTTIIYGKALREYQKLQGVLFVSPFKFWNITTNNSMDILRYYQCYGFSMKLFIKLFFLIN